MSVKQKCPICTRDICECSWHCTCDANEIVSHFFRKRMQLIKDQKYIEPMDVNNVVPVEYVHAIEIFKFWNKSPRNRQQKTIPQVEWKSVEKTNVITPWSSIRKWIK